MSGEKDARVEAIDERRMREAAARGAERARQRELTAEACAAAARELSAAAARLQSLENERAAVAARYADVGNRLREVSVERARAARKVQEMRRETTETRNRVQELSSDISAERHRLQKDMDLLNTKERELREEFESLARRIASYDGHELVEARSAAAAAEEKQARVNADLAQIEAQIAAYQSSPALGFVFEQMVSSFSAFQFHVDRAFVSDGDIEIVMSRNGQETVRIATALIADKLAAAQLDPRLRLLIERTEPDVDACIADTMKIMQRLRENGVVVSLEVREPSTGTPADRTRTPDRDTRTRT